MIIVYRQADSISAQQLANACGGVVCTNPHTAMELLTIPDPLFVGWGDWIAELPSTIPQINNTSPLNKIKELKLLDTAGVPTLIWTTYCPAYPTDHWLPRHRHHTGADDLLTPTNPDYWVRRESLIREYRVHSFDGLSIYAGTKTKVRPDAHPWIRSHRCGWETRFNGVTPRIRTIAHQAVKALGLTFGAVDIGEREDGSLLILEINRAPALDGGALHYASAIRRSRDHH